MPVVVALALALAGQPLDVLTFGDTASEASHALLAPGSDLVGGPGGFPLRRLLPLDPPSYTGAAMAFSMACDPREATYLSARLDGSAHDEAQGRLVVVCEGQQVGWQHLGEVDPLDIAGGGPISPDQYYWRTLPLPRHLTAGRTSVNLEIRSMGRIWGYGNSMEEYYKVLDRPSRGIGRLYTHTQPSLPLPADEPRLPVPAAAVRPAPGPEVIDAVKRRVNGDVAKWVRADGPAELLQLTVLAKAWHAPWADAYHSEALVGRVIEVIDDLCQRFADDPKLTDSEPKWRSFGPAGYAVAALAEPLKPHLEESIMVGGQRRTRLQAWADVLAASVDWRRTHRRSYTNQSMISDMNLYQSNRGLAVLAPERALTEEAVRRYLHESAGLLPWLGNDTRDGGSEQPLGDNYYQTTRRGQTRELGYVGGYGEVIDWVCKLYDSTCAGGTPGDQALLDQLEKLVQARLPFRYAGVDSDGYRSVLLETDVGWRDSAPPGPTLYGQRAGWESSPIQAAALLGRGPILAAAQSQMADNQLYAALGGALSSGSVDATLTLVGVPDEYAKVISLPPAAQKLPMLDNRDFLWADEQNGVLALKVGERRLYASLYWRARYGVNSLARIHELRPDGQRFATVWEDGYFRDSHLRYTYPDWTDRAFASSQKPLPGTAPQAMAGQTIPIAAVPPGEQQPRPGAESPFVGRGTFYQLRYDDLLIGMNLTGLDGVPERSFELTAPEGSVRLPERTPVSGTVLVSPASTVVLLLGGELR